METFDKKAHEIDEALRFIDSVTEGNEEVEKAKALFAAGAELEFNAWAQTDTLILDDVEYGVLEYEEENFYQWAPFKNFQA